MTYFKNCTSLDEIKQLYRTLAKQFHPDVAGGNLEVMQKINSEYPVAIAHMAAGQNMSNDEIETEILAAEAYQEAVNKVVNLAGTTLELVGTWLWITGDTKQYASLLKTDPAKFRWAKKRTDLSAWFFRTEEYACRGRGSKQSLDQIKSKYGSQTITSKTSFVR